MSTYRADPSRSRHPPLQLIEPLEPLTPMMLPVPPLPKVLVPPVPPEPGLMLPPVPPDCAPGSSPSLGLPLPLAEQPPRNPIPRLRPARVFRVE